ncbi:MAG: V-type ATP synthase subunit I [Spirochaetes bacterium]|nr:V-type ATP synthase subunit I [Spirochaetota bacterium]
MKKVYLVLLESRRRESLARLKRVGVVHIETFGKSSETLEQIQEKRQYLQRALQALPFEPKGKKEVSNGPVEKETSLLQEEHVYSLAEKINQTADQLRTFKEEADKLFREIDFWEKWGDFNPEDVRELEQKGVLLRLYEVRVPMLSQLPNTGLRILLWKTKEYAGIVWIGRTESEFPKGLEPLPLPRKGLSLLRAEYREKRREIHQLERELFELSRFRKDVERMLEHLEESLEFEQVSADLEQEGVLLYLSGYVPEPKLKDLKKAASENGWGLLIREPAPDEVVPTLLENPRWIRIVQPVFQLLGTIPGYREVDISFFFLLFFSLFFAMIIGDGGYGVILFGLSLYFASKEKKRIGVISDGLLLLLVMGFGTIIWGALTGTWFGFEPFSKIAPFKWFVVPSLSSWNPRSSETIKHFTFIIGTVHLSIAHGWNFLREFSKTPRIRAFAQLGWLSMVLGLYFLVLNLALDSRKYPVPTVAVYMILGGLAAVFIFGQQEGNFIKGVLKGFSGFITTFLSGISVFSDIVSYIRLFAVGLASIEIAKSFNGISMGLMQHPIGMVLGVVIIIFGHGLNLAMGGLAVVVHGVRLNLLEFSNHLGLEWSGFAYRPFRERGEEVM